MNEYTQNMPDFMPVFKRIVCNPADSSERLLYLTHFYGCTELLAFVLWLQTLKKLLCFWC